MESAAVPPSEPPASLGDRVWSDLDHDGVQDPGEPGLDGVTVTLYDGSGGMLAAQVSGPGGAYGFADLAPGSYQVGFAGLPPGALLTPQGTVPGDGTDSDPDPTTGRTGSIDLAADEDDDSVDAGVWVPAPALTTEKRVGGHDADEAPGPPVPVGAEVTFDYEVTNTGNEDLVELAVVDDQGVAVTCPQTAVARTETVVCTGVATAIRGAYRNVGTVTAVGADSGQSVSEEDRAHYTGVEPLLELAKRVDGDDADSATEPLTVAAGQPIEFTFSVTNTGAEPVTGIALTDGAISVTCPAAVLDPGDSMDCTPLVGAAEPGLHTNTATVTGTGAVSGSPTGATDGASYFGRAPMIGFLKEVLDPTTGGYLDADADVGTQGSNDGVAVVLATGSTARFRFRLANSGNVALEAPSVSDPQCDAGPGVVSGDGGTAGVLDVGETWLLACERGGVTAAFTNTATAQAGGLSATERARVEVETAPDLALAKALEDRDGDVVVWSLVVSNRGPGPFAGPVTVVDDLPAGLAPVSGTGGGFTCSAAGRRVTCARAADLPAGATATVRLTTRLSPTATGTLVNRAEVSGASADADAANNVATAPLSTG
ncbi:MAG TPA: SdrD B-like domain-containing protein, partial [Acidimicrobiales bacterium]|nr:SdrD B-like domain-containing protein [Acidimicrobiales bacterium]